mgnify:CR=1 FL=1
MIESVTREYFLYNTPILLWVKRTTAPQVVNKG